MRPVIALLLHNRNGNASKARRPRWEALAAGGELDLYEHVRARSLIRHLERQPNG